MFITYLLPVCLAQARQTSDTTDAPSAESAPPTVSTKATSSTDTLAATDSAQIDSLKLQAAFAAVADNHHIVVQNLTDVLKVVSSDSSLYYRLGLAYDGLWQYENAVTAYRNAIEHGMDTPETQRELALALIESRQYEEAASILSELLKKFPSHVSLRMGYAIALAGQGRTDEAREDSEILHQMYPMSARLTAQYAEVLWIAGEKEQAFDLVEAYIENRPEDALMYSLLGEMHLRTDDIEAAHRTFLTGRDRLKRRSSRVRAIFDSGLTYTFAKKGIPDKALDHAESAFEQTPNNPYLYRNRGLALRRPKM